ncbi:type II toxin-antitoxin system death-on-curing family toxin [Cellulomonas fimi]|uniref:Death-on-curing family protein n=1 Tax=Cellulomonas fimi (strain ATCC 484 / DSM 20113 / JCM 1341 / CCUG 24087 / LMG 16345 / NBRC 15513 / NCIMB 8980 / NCTC 7547 / NRS-133) TaxID=590998 RepID=F4H426_CELFA|nr:Fic family protein [Cellulomonas fimi]AEE45378.1 death-on-curing family protein [Cellulomonas fimi ATCC 484]NNH06868.1 type II toxin-antitoxin system death-on-curing family toxin [Cellulomonas fimi]VEH29173.1 death-on-curing family protein [Cellulomonas fimi]
MIYLTAEELLAVARRVVGDLVVRDVGLIESAAARPRTQIGGADAYPDLLAKAAALLHSLTRNRALVDGNTRLALAGTIVFLGVNGTRLTATNDEAYDLIMDVAAGRVDDVESIRARLLRLTGAW